jgi:hypothetical protein
VAIPADERPSVRTNIELPKLLLTVYDESDVAVTVDDMVSRATAIPVAEL